MANFAPGFLSYAICDRCKLRYDYREIKADGNSPGLRVCPGCWDSIDPYRLPRRRQEPFVVQYPRPDVPLDGNPLGLITDDGTGFVTTDDGEGYIKP